MKKIFALILFMFFSLSGVVLADEVTEDQPIFDPRPFTQKRFCDYIEYLNYSEYYANRDLPGRPSLILIMHSGREKGNLEKQLSTFAVTSLLKYVEKYNIKTVILVPNFPRLYGPYSKDTKDMVLELVKQKAREYNVPSKKIYATGASFGGSALYSMMLEEPKTFKKILFVSYASAESIQYANLRNIQLYFIVGTKDETIHLDEALAGFEKKNNKTILIEYKFLKGKTHLETMDVAYTDDVWDWLFRNTIMRAIFDTSN